MTSKPPPAVMSPEAESIHRSLDYLCSVPDDSFPCENPRLFASLARRLQLLLSHFLRSPDLPSSPTFHTVLKGIAADLSKAAETVFIYREKSKIFVLLNCSPLCSALRDRAAAIGGWLALLDSTLLGSDGGGCDSNCAADLRKKITDLSRDMKQAQFRVTENEYRIYCTLQQEGQGRPTTRAVQSAIIMDLARALGVDSTDYLQISQQVKLLSNDLARSNSVSDRRVLISLERIVNTLSLEPIYLAPTIDFDDDEHDSQITPFKNFLCPLTKEVMKDPVVLESSQTYERAAIEYWFQRCLEDGRDPTCPVTGQVLTSLEQKPNIGLAGAIEEWLNRNIDIQIKLALQCLTGADLSGVGNGVERVLDSLYKISEDHPSSRYKIRNAGIVILLINLLKSGSKSSVGPLLRGKALMVLLTLANDEDSKTVMLEGGVTKLATRSLLSSSEKEKEKESALRLLLKLSSDEPGCAKITSEKGALVLLSSLAGNMEDPILSNLAENVLKHLELVEDNIQHLATVGRFEPLISRLYQGSDEVKAKMASILGQLTLTHNNKEQIARQSAKVLIDMLSKPEGMTPSLQALSSLAALDDSASILVDSSVLPALTRILFDGQEAKAEHQELAASIIANIVSKPGHWELAVADKHGHRMHSYFMMSHLLGLLSHVTLLCQVSVLKILCGMASSAQASEPVASHMKSGDGIKIILQYLEHEDVDLRASAFKFIRILSANSSEYITDQIKGLNKLELLRDKVQGTESTGERSDAARVLANLTLSREEVQSFLGDDFFRWTITTLKEEHQLQISGGRATCSGTVSTLTEGLLGILVLFTKGIEPQSLSVVREHQVMIMFREQLTCSHTKLKQLGALGLKHLSELMTIMSDGESDPQPPHGLCSSMVFICGGRANLEPSTCPIHHAQCDEDSQLCLLKNHCIKPLVGLLADEHTSVQMASVDALSTLVSMSDSSSHSGFHRAVLELENLGVIDAVINLFIDSRPGDLQEKTMWMIERVLRCERTSIRYSPNRSLIGALVEALKHGTADTKRNAQYALTYLQQLSGNSGQISAQIRR